MLNTYTFESLCNIHTNFSCEIKNFKLHYRFKLKIIQQVFFYYFLQNVNQMKWNVTLDAWVTIEIIVIHNVHEYSLFQEINK